MSFFLSMIHAFTPFLCCSLHVRQFDYTAGRETDQVRYCSIIKVLSCRLMPHEGTFQLQTDLPLSCYKICFKAGENFEMFSMVLKLKLEGMTKE